MREVVPERREGGEVGERVIDEPGQRRRREHGEALREQAGAGVGRGERVVEVDEHGSRIVHAVDRAANLEPELVAGPGAQRARRRPRGLRSGLGVYIRPGVAMKLCIVSPHLDDALLSCGVLIQRRRALGDEVLILNVFTAGARAAERRAEDVRATARLGADAEYLGELDAPDRDAAFQSVQALVFGALDAGELVDRIERGVREVLAAHAIDVAYFPLAVGTHIDHRVAHAVGRRIDDRAARFYEDRPYVLWPGALQARMRELGVDAGLPEVSPEAMAAAVDDYAYLEYFLPRALRAELLPMYLRGLAPTRPGVAARCEALTATADELHTMYSALAGYTSQMPRIYPDEPTFMRDSLRHEEARTGERAYVERAWALP